MYKCKYYKIGELVHPNILKEVSEDILWMMFDDRLLKAADIIREAYGPIFVNDSKLQLFNCGLRELDTKTGAKYSAHKIGRALDLHILSIENKGLSKEDKIKVYNRIRGEILNIDFPNLDLDRSLEYEEYLGCLNFEKDISWLHIDTYNRPSREFNP